MGVKMMPLAVRQRCLPANARPASSGLRISSRRLVTLMAGGSKEGGLKRMEGTRAAVRGAVVERKQAGRKDSALRASPGADTALTGGQPAAESAAVRELREITKDDYYLTLKAAEERLVVVDFYTTWCGPCKAMMPKLLDMQDEFSSAVFVKFNCNKYNKELGQELGIRVAPTFFLYKNQQKVAEMTGAKVEELRALIQKHV